MPGRIKQLIQTDSGRFSLTKFWSFIGCGVATYIVLHLTVKDKMTWEIFLAYLGTVAGFSQVSKWLAYRYGVKADVVTATESDASVVEIQKCSDCASTGAGTKTLSSSSTKSTTTTQSKPAAPAEPAEPAKPAEPAEPAKPADPIEEPGD
jgi:hypothetical protein